MQRIPFFLLLIFLGTGCSKELLAPQSSTVAGVEVVFLNADGAYTYQKRESRYLREQLQPIDVSIILEEDLSDLDSAAVRQRYLDNLQKNTLDWTERELKNFRELLEETFLEIADRTPKVLPDTLYLIKTTGNETIGKGTMYTSAKSLTIPRMNTRTAGLGFLSDEVEATLQHELFHIYSNQHPEVRPELYALIGFYPIDLDLGELGRQIIANPDADANWAIRLEHNGVSLEAVLLTYSPYPTWEGSKSPLGLKPGKGYLDYGLFEVTPENGVYRLTNGLTELDLNTVEESFRAQIGRNTDYLLAVEEILADTYPLIFDVPEEASVRDREIIEALKERLR